MNQKTKIAKIYYYEHQSINNHIYIGTTSSRPIHFQNKKKYLFCNIWFPAFASRDFPLQIYFVDCVKRDNLVCLVLYIGKNKEMAEKKKGVWQLDIRIFRTIATTNRCFCTINFHFKHFFKINFYACIFEVFWA